MRVWQIPFLITVLILSSGCTPSKNFGRPGSVNAAERSDRKRAEAPGTVIVTEEEIKRHGPGSVNGALRRVPGVYVPGN